MTIFTKYLISLLFLSIMTGVSGCAGRPQTQSGTAIEPERMMAVAYRDIASVYIHEPEFASLSLVGLNSLQSVDPDISTKLEAQHLVLSYGDTPIARFPAPEKSDAQGWAEVMASSLDTYETASPKLQQVDREEVYGAMLGAMAKSLDQYSSYSSRLDASERRASREGFGGIGVQIAVEEDFPKIISVMHYTPAERAGLKAGDVILSADNLSLESLSQEEVIRRLRGPTGTSITLQLQRPGPDGRFSVSITREHVVPETVTYRREENIAYFRIFSFNSETTESLVREIRRAKQEMTDDMQGAILDMRGNPGGLLDQAVSVSDLFLNSGRIVSTHGRHADSHQYFEASEGDILAGTPLVVIVNGNSASAAEIVAGALQDNGRAVVVGSSSFGKGTVQTVLAMPNDGELTLTWALFHAPSGYTINKRGITPSLCTAQRPRHLVTIGGFLKKVQQSRETSRATPLKAELSTAEVASLRATCPGREEENEADIDLALDLLQDRQSFVQALRLDQKAQLSAQK